MKTMKKQLLGMVACAAFAAMPAMAQAPKGTFSITPKVGVNMASLTGDAPMSVTAVYVPHLEPGQIINPGDDQPQKAEFGFTKHSSRFGFTGGVELGYQLSDKWALAGEVMYSMQGAKYDDVDFAGLSKVSNAEVKMQSINVPITAKYYVYRGLAVRAGIQPSFITSKMDCDLHWNGRDLNMKDEKIDYMSSFELAVPVGVSYEFGNVVVDARYTFGVTNLYKDEIKRYEDVPMKPTSHTSMLTLTAGYKFNL